MDTPAAPRRLVTGLTLALVLLATTRPLIAQLARITVAEGVYLFRAPADGFLSGNSVAVVTDRDVVVFDSHTRPTTAQSVLDDLRTLTDKPVGVVVNSHWHPDHWSGNQVYVRAFPEADIIATAATRAFMKRVAPSWPAIYGRILRRREAAVAEADRTGRDAAGRTLTPDLRRRLEARLDSLRRFTAEIIAVERKLPTQTFGDSLTLWRGGREIRLIRLSGDATGSTMMYLPHERIAVVGDLLVHPVPWDPNSYEIGAWLHGLRQLRGLGARVIVPGHGPALSDPEYLDLVIDLLESISAQVGAALEAGAVTVEDVARAVDVTVFRGRFAQGNSAVEREFDGSTEALIRKAYLEARDGLESTD